MNDRANRTRIVHPPGCGCADCISLPLYASQPREITPEMQQMAKDAERYRKITKEKPAVPFPPFSSKPPVNTYSESYPATEEIIEWLMKRWDETREPFYLFASARLTSTSFAARKDTCKHGRETRLGCSSCLQERQS